MTQIRQRRRLSTEAAGYQPEARGPMPPPPPPRTRVKPVAKAVEAAAVSPEPSAAEEQHHEPASRAERTAAVGAWKTVSRAQYRGRQLLSEEHEEEQIAVPAFQGPVGYVNVDGGITRNMGDFNSVRVRVAISLPCYPEDTEIRRAYQHASNLIDELLPTELDKAMGNEGQ